MTEDMTVNNGTLSLCAQNATLTEIRTMVLCTQLTAYTHKPVSCNQCSTDQSTQNQWLPVMSLCQLLS